MHNKDKKLFIFDMGNVTILNDNGYEDLAMALGIELEAFLSDNNDYAYPMMDGELSTRAYWSHIEHKFKINVPLDPFYDFFKAEENTIMIEIIEKLKKAGKRVVCGTNTIHPHYQKLLELNIPSHFHKVYTSMDLGLSKPYKEFFETILREEAVNPEDTFFIDDYESFIKGASSIGISTFHYAGDNRNERLKEIFSWL